MAGRAKWVIGLVLAAATAGCGQQVIDEVERSAGAPAVQPKWEACPAPAVPSGGVPVLGAGFDDAQDALTLPRLDDSFHPVSAVVCRGGVQDRPSGGSDAVAIEERATDLTVLLAAFKLPDEPPTNGPCTADLVIPPWLALLDADGRWIRPGVPVDACRKPRIEFRDAVTKTAWTRVSTTVRNEIKSDEAATSGCEQQWSDMVWVTGQDGEKAAAPLPSLAPDRTPMRICVYQVPASERGGGKPAGDFRSGGLAPAARWTAIKRELAASATPAPACATPATRFAVLHSEAAGDIYVEGDHCGRVLIDNGPGPAVLRAGTPELTRLVFAR